MLRRGHLHRADRIPARREDVPRDSDPVGARHLLPHLRRQRAPGSLRFRALPPGEPRASCSSPAARRLACVASAAVPDTKDKPRTRPARDVRSRVRGRVRRRTTIADQAPGADRTRPGDPRGVAAARALYRPSAAAQDTAPARRTDQARVPPSSSPDPSHSGDCGGFGDFAAQRCSVWQQVACAINLKAYNGSICPLRGRTARGLAAGGLWSPTRHSEGGFGRSGPEDSLFPRRSFRGKERYGSGVAAPDRSWPAQYDMCADWRVSGAFLRCRSERLLRKRRRVVPPCRLKLRQNVSLAGPLGLARVLSRRGGPAAADPYPSS